MNFPMHTGLTKFKVDELVRVKEEQSPLFLLTMMNIHKFGQEKDKNESMIKVHCRICKQIIVLLFMNR